MLALIFGLLLWAVVLRLLLAWHERRVDDKSFERFYVATPLRICPGLTVRRTERTALSNWVFGKRWTVESDDGSWARFLLKTPEARAMVLGFDRGLQYCGK